MEYYVLHSVLYIYTYRVKVIEREIYIYQGNGVTSRDSDYVGTGDNAAACLVNECSDFVDGLESCRPQCQIGWRLLLAGPTGRPIKQDRSVASLHNTRTRKIFSVFLEWFAQNSATLTKFEMKVDYIVD